MLKYITGFVVLLGAGILAYRTYARFHPDETALKINADILAAAERMHESHESKDATSDASVVVPAAEVGDAPVPLFVGATWRYRVTDSRKPDVSKNWVMTVERAPDDTGIGAAGTGFEGQTAVAPVVNRDGDVRLDGLGFWAPPIFGDVKAAKIEGETLPRNLRMIEGAVWEQRIERRVTYKHVDKKGVSKESTGEALEKHRATAFKLETVSVPKGQFTARRIEWSSRVGIQTKGRPVLMPLTTEPYRKETMWVVPGVGIIKRSISFLTEDGPGTVVLELESGPKE